MCPESISPDSCLDALGNPVRRAILQSLKTTHRSVVDISRDWPISRPAISKHLKVLEQAGLLRSVRRGTRNFYEINPVGFGAARQWLDEFWESALPNYIQVAESTMKQEIV